MRLSGLLLSAVALAACSHMEAKSVPSAAATAQMSEKTDAEADKLNHLTRIAIDASTLYGESAEMSEDAALKSELSMLAAHRKTFAVTLQNRVSELGGKPAESGEAIGAVHRSFTAARALVQNDSVAAAGEVYRGESYLIDEIDGALKAGVSVPSRQIIAKELVDVKAGRDRIEAIQNRLKAASGSKSAG